MEGGPSDFPQGFSCPVVLWILPAALGLRLRGFHPLWLAFPKPSGWLHTCVMAVRNPGAHARRFRLAPFRSPLLRGSSFLPFPPGTYMFQFPGFPSICYGFTYGCMECVHTGFPIQRSPDRRSFAPPRGLSQLVTSFIGSQCQGIRPAPFLFDRPSVSP